MKRQKFLLASVFLAIIFIACSKKIVTGKDAAPPATSEASSAAPSNMPSARTPDANLLTAGKIIYETKCTRCHGLKPADALTELRWDGILKIMIPKANLTEPEAQQVTTYLKANAKK